LLETSSAVQTVVLSMSVVLWVLREPHPADCEASW